MANTTARWITTPAFPNAHFVLFRRTLPLVTDPVPLLINVSSRTPFELYVNSRRVHASADYKSGGNISILVESGFTWGLNVIVARVLAVDVNESHTATYPTSVGFYLEGRMHGVDISTNESWRCAPYRASKVSVRRLQHTDASGMLSGTYRAVIEEHFDGVINPIGWKGTRFDDASWPLAAIRAQPDWNGLPFLAAPALQVYVQRRRCFNSAMQDNQSTYIPESETRLWWTSFVRSLVPSHTTKHAILCIADQTFTPEASGLTSTQDSQQQTSDTHATRLLNAYVEISIIGGAGTTIDISYAETVEELEDYAPTDHIVISKDLIKDQHFHFAPFQARRFRYVKITVSMKEEPIRALEIFLTQLYEN